MLQQVSIPPLAPTIEWGTLRLRPLRSNDAASLLAYLVDPVVIEHTSYPVQSRRSVEVLIEKSQQGYADRSSCKWALARISDDVVIGTCGFDNWVPEHAWAEFTVLVLAPQGLGDSGGMSGGDSPKLLIQRDMCELPPAVSANFDTLGVPLLAGQDFRPSDTPESPPVAIISQSMAKLWKGADPVGRRFTARDFDGERTFTVIAVAAVYRLYDVEQENPAQYYRAVVSHPVGASACLLAPMVIRETWCPSSRLQSTAPTRTHRWKKSRRLPRSGGRRNWPRRESRPHSSRSSPWSPWRSRWRASAGSSAPASASGPASSACGWRSVRAALPCCGSCCARA
ncbi:MAG: GNAT family N-acetyltransferase [Luteitalea sp.]|nr:GNAT family N-acetyltransferase [Luteitalea sp.]